MRDVVSRYGIKIRNGFISCPFHSGDRSPSMKLYDKTFYCFGCGATGDIFDFVKRIDNCSFKEAFLSLGGEYKKTTTSKRLQRHRKLARQDQKNKKEYEKLREKEVKENISREIELVRFIKRHSEPLSDRWCWATNKLQFLLQKFEGAETYQE